MLVTLNELYDGYEISKKSKIVMKKVPNIEIHDYIKKQNCSIYFMDGDKYAFAIKIQSYKRYGDDLNNALVVYSFGKSDICGIDDINLHPYLIYYWNKKRGGTYFKYDALILSTLSRNPKNSCYRARCPEKDPPEVEYLKSCFGIMEDLENDREKCKRCAFSNDVVCRLCDKNKYFKEKKDTINEKVDDFVSNFNVRPPFTC